MRKYTLLFLLFLIISVSTQAQVENNLDDLKTAYINIQKGDYSEAYPYFKEMQRIYPKEPGYNYYLGRCLLFLDTNSLESIKYLRFASTKEVSEDVYFYLGLAYIKNYQFEKAIKNLEWFNKRASKKQLKKLNVQNYLSIAQNGLYLIKYVKKPDVYSKELQNKNKFHEKYILDDVKGSFVKRNEYIESIKDTIGKNSLMYIPRVVEINDVLYFSGLNKKRNDYDIFRIVRLSDTSWSEPENLGEIINTPFDEEYPYLHSDGVTLYFASKGHYSMGGYDLYSSTWSWDTQEWSEPENLDFPINSPYNDILFVSSPNKKVAFFASDRETSPDNVMVYKLKLNNSEPYIEIDNHQELIEYSKLNVNIDSKTEKKNKQEDKYKPNQQNLVKIKNKETFLHKFEYDSLLNLAINYQLKADSLRWVIDEKRVVFDNTEEGPDRAKLTNTIIEIERAIYALQKKADECYERVRVIEQVNLASQKQIYEDVKRVDEIKTSDQINESSIYIEPVLDLLVKSRLLIVEDISEEIENPFNVGLRVEIPSIYNTSNPIPQNETLPKGIVYMIQMGAFSSEKAPSVFKGLTPLTSIKKKDSKIRRYLAGKFLQLKDAEKSLPTVRSKGFKDAYIVAFQDGKIISVKNAVKLESKNVDIINSPVVNNEKSNDKEDDLSIIYVLKGQVDVNDTVTIEEVKAELLEGEDLYIEKKDNSQIILIKSYLSYDDASIRKRKLEAIMKKEIEIHAYFAENQIPLEQAIKITE